MAIRNYLQEEQDRNQKEAFDKLIAFLKANNNQDALGHITTLESTIKQQEIKIQEYQNFFNLMSKLTPKQPSIHDVIG